jgi:hypothetical protein
MSTTLNRRDFLKLAAAAGLTGFAFRPFSGFTDDTQDISLARVTIRSVSVHSQPSDKSRILFQRFRDELVHIYYEMESEDGPGYNPIWYRVWGGYMHRANLQRVLVRYNDVASKIPEEGQLAEVTVPYTQAMRFNNSSGWDLLYRLYYTSTHWVTGIDEGPDGEAWYRLKDELLEVEYHVPAHHLRLIPPEELSPISPDVPAHRKWVEVDLSRQQITCYEREEPVFQTKISSGLNYSPPGELAWNTPKGEFNVYSKMPSKHMGNGRLSGNPEDYELPGVPWTSFFEQTGVAFHGTYWHDDFGIPRSHGCINMRSEEAKWLFRWLTPVNDPGEVEKRGFGTRVVVF